MMAGRIVMGRVARVLTIGVIGAGALACGDQGDEARDDERGYTKAPLEDPGWIVDSEERTAMDLLGDPVLIPMMDTLAADTVATEPGAEAGATSDTPATGGANGSDTAAAPDA